MIDIQFGRYVNVGTRVCRLCAVVVCVCVCAFMPVYRCVGVQVCVAVSIGVCVSVCLHSYIHKSTDVYTSTRTHTHLHTYTHLHLHTPTPTHTHTHTHLHTHHTCLANSAGTRATSDSRADAGRDPCTRSHTSAQFQTRIHALPRPVICATSHAPSLSIVVCCNACIMLLYC